MPLDHAYSLRRAEMDSIQPAARDTHLVLVFKAPQRAKSRLRKQLGRSADELATQLLCCALDDLRRWSGPVTLAATSSEDARWLAERGCWPNAPLIQRSGNLGERIAQLDLELRRTGAERIIFIGSDCPAMDHEYLVKAAEQLNQQDFVLGEAVDGGVSLMGARRAWPSLADLPWSTGQLGTALARRCGIELTLPPLRDVDDIDDLGPLFTELATDNRPTRVTLKHWLATWAS